MSWVATVEATLTAEQARALTDKICKRLADLLPLIKEAYEGRADRALGYDSWHDYCTTELGGVRIPLADRPMMVADLRQNGMSTRAIGSALGISKDTVARELARVSDETRVKVNGFDGKTYPAARPAAPELPARQDVADKIVAGIDQHVASTSAGQDLPPAPVEPERPRPPKWEPDERRAHEEEVLLRQDIDAARRGAETLVTDVRALIFTVVHGSRRGARGLVTADMISDLRKAIDLLEGEINSEE